MVAKRRTLLRVIRPHVTLHRDPLTGIAWVEDGTTGNEHGPHPAIDSSGSVSGMKKLGYWGKNDITQRCHHQIYNLTRWSVTSDLDQIAADACQCAVCTIRRKGGLA